MAMISIAAPPETVFKIGAQLNQSWRTRHKLIGEKSDDGKQFRILGET